MGEFSTHFATRLDISVFRAAHGGHGTRREERAFREDVTLDDAAPELAEHWKPGVVFVWLCCPRCKTQILIDGVVGAPRP
jgi:hypothetical protein